MQKSRKLSGYKNLRDDVNSLPPGTGYNAGELRSWMNNNVFSFAHLPCGLAAGNALAYGFNIMLEYC
jgi:hypothetical protein